MKQNVAKNSNMDVIDRWQRSLPCTTCTLSNICKYTGIFANRPNYPDDVFKVSITCKHYVEDASLKRKSKGCDTATIPEHIAEQRMREVYGAEPRVFEINE